MWCRPDAERWVDSTKSTLLTTQTNRQANKQTNKRTNKNCVQIRITGVRSYFGYFVLILLTLMCGLFIGSRSGSTVSGPRRVTSTMTVKRLTNSNTITNTILLCLVHRLFRLFDRGPNRDLHKFWSKKLYRLVRVLSGWGICTCNAILIDKDTNTSVSVCAYLMNRLSHSNMGRRLYLFEPVSRSISSAGIMIPYELS